MKKVIVVILSLLVLALLTTWVYDALYSKPVGQNDNVNVEQTENSDWITYRNEELGIVFDYDDDKYNISINKEGILDQGKKRSVILRDKNSSSIVLSIVGSSADYSVGVGEGCCYDYSDATLDLNQNINELEKQLLDYKPVNLQKINIGPSEIETVRLLGVDKYARYSVKDIIIIPYDFNEMSNLFISGPILISREGTSQDIFDKVVFKAQNSEFDSKAREERKIFERSISSFRFID